jgi:predicted DNA-binding protein
MPAGEGKVTLSATVPVELKERFQRIAAEKRWSVSQTVTIFIEEYLDTWEDELGISQKEDIPKRPKR